MTPLLALWTLILALPVSGRAETDFAFELATSWQRSSDPGVYVFDDDRYLNSSGLRAVAFPSVLPEGLGIVAEYGYANHVGRIFDAIGTRLVLEEFDLGAEYSWGWAWLLPEISPADSQEIDGPRRIMSEVLHRLRFASQHVHLTARATGQALWARSQFVGARSTTTDWSFGPSYRIALGPSIVIEPGEIPHFPLGIVARYQAGYRGRSDLEFGQAGTLSIEGLFHTLTLGVQF